VWHFSVNFWHCLWKFVTCSVSQDIVSKALLCYTVALLHTTSSKFWCLSRLLFVTKYHQQHFSQHRRQAKCTAVPLQIVELSHSHSTWLLVDTKSKIPLLNHQNRIKQQLLYILVKGSTSVCEVVYHLTYIRGSGSKQSLTNISLTLQIIAQGTDRCRRRNFEMREWTETDALQEALGATHACLFGQLSTWHLSLTLTSKPSRQRNRSDSTNTPADS